MICGNCKFWVFIGTIECSYIGQCANKESSEYDSYKDEDFSCRKFKEIKD